MTGDSTGLDFHKLTDVVMPNMGGEELARRACSLDPNIRIIFVSGYNDGGAVRRSRPFLRLLPKPYTFCDLTATIRECLRPNLVRRALRVDFRNLIRLLC